MYATRIRHISFVVLPLLLCTTACSSFDEDIEYLVVPYSGPELTEDKVRESWTIRIEGNKVILREEEQFYNKGNVPVITLEDRGDELPVILDAWVGPAGGGLGDTVDKVTFEVVSWDLEGEIIGIFNLSDELSGVAHPLIWEDLANQ